MSRLATLTPDALTAAQRRAYDEIVALRAQVPESHRGIYQPLTPQSDGSLSGPFNAWLRTPEIGTLLVALGGALRFRTTLPPRLIELAILVAAREWTAQYEWAAHARFAERAGVGAEIIEAIRTRRTPSLPKPDEAAVYGFVTELLRSHGVSDATYQRALGAVGEPGIVELIALLGFYTTVSMALNTFRVEVPGEPPLQP
jgi:4-carboxymuconolactone decarboxylase